MDLVDTVFAVSPDIRYVALYRDGRLEMRERVGLANSSDSESDRYEELIVNPTLLVLTRQRGEIDCGGLRYVIVGYGNFYQFIVPIDHGHISIAFELQANPLQYADTVMNVLHEFGLISNSPGLKD